MISHIHNTLTADIDVWMTAVTWTCRGFSRAQCAAWAAGAGTARRTARAARATAGRRRRAAVMRTTPWWDSSACWSPRSSDRLMTGICGRGRKMSVHQYKFLFNKLLRAKNTLQSMESGVWVLSFLQVIY